MKHYLIYYFVFQLIIKPILKTNIRTLKGLKYFTNNINVCYKNEYVTYKNDLKHNNITKYILRGLVKTAI